MSKTKLVEVMSRSPFRLRGKIVRAVNRGERREYRGLT